MKRLAALLVATILASAPARATEWLVCNDAGGKASISVLLGAMEVIAVNDIKIAVGDKTWSTTPGEGTPITRGQAFETADQMWIDVTDADVAAIVAQLRLFEASEGDSVVAAGTLRMPGVGAWAVTCEGP
jgi:hypothetical protein